MRWFVVCVLATSVMGCSFVAGIHHATAEPQPSCGWLAGAAAVDAIAAGVMIAVLNSANPGADPPDLSIGDAEGLALGGYAFGISAIDGLYAAGRCHAEHAARDRLARTKAREEAAEQQRIAVRERAWKLTAEAEAAARAGDCSRVWTLDPQIAAIDLEMHDVVFARDVAVNRCRAATP